MRNGIYLTIDDDGKAREVKYDNRYDITIHCESQESHDRVLELLEKAKSMRWIPVAERLPEEDGEYLCSLRVRDNPSSIDKWVFSYGHFRLFGQNMDKLVKAWMPLPEPYKED